MNFIIGFSYCHYMHVAESLMPSAAVVYLDEVEDGDGMHASLASENGTWKSPYVFVADMYIGGSDDLAVFLGRENHNF